MANAPPAQPRPPAILTGASAVALSCYTIISLVVFRPWHRVPFDTRDYSEFLLLLKGADGFVSRFTLLAEYYATHGRVAEIVYALIATNQGLFGLDPLGWQLTQAAPLLVLPWLAFYALRKLGFGAVASLLGSSLFVTTSSVSSAWLRFAAEPIGTIFLLCSIVVARGWSSREAKPAEMGLLAACLCGMLFSKETLVAAVPFVFLIGLFWGHENTLVLPVRVRSAWILAGLCISASALMGLALVATRSVQSPEAYALQYGAGAWQSAPIAGRALELLLPSVYVVTERLLMPLVVPWNLVFAVCVVAASILLAWHKNWPASVKGILGLSLPFAGFLVYLPWPRSEPFYWLPFLVGLSITLAVLFDTVTLGGRGRLVACMCGAFVVWGASLDAFSVANLMRADRVLTFQVAREVAEKQANDTVVLTTADITELSWQNPAETMRRYLQAVELSRTPPVIVDRDCKDGASSDPTTLDRTTMEIWFEAGCGAPHWDGRPVEITFSYFDLSAFKVKRGIRRAMIRLNVGGGRL